MNFFRLRLDRRGLTGIESESRPRGEENAREGVQPCLCKLAYLATTCIGLNSFQSPPIHRGRKNSRPQPGTTHSPLLMAAPLTTSSDGTCSSLASHSCRWWSMGLIALFSIFLIHFSIHLRLPHFPLLSIFLASHDLPCFSESHHSSRPMVRPELQPQSDMHGHGKEPPSLYEAMP
jgi:hypothetical protein